MINYEPVLIIITPVIAASILSFLSPILKIEKTNRIQKNIALIGLILPLCYLLYLYPTVSITPIQYNMGGWLSPYAITLVIDSFNYTFLIISSLITFLAYIFSIKDINKAKDKFSFFFLLMVAGIYGVFLSIDLFNKSCTSAITSYWSSLGCDLIYIDDSSTTKFSIRRSCSE